MFLKKRPSAFLRVRNTYCNVKKGISQLVFYYHLSKNKLKRCDAPIGEITKPYRTRKLHHRQRSVMAFFIIESLSRSVKIVNGHSQIISGDRYKSGRLKMWPRFCLILRTHQFIVRSPEEPMPRHQEIQCDYPA